MTPTKRAYTPALFAPVAPMAPGSEDFVRLYEAMTERIVQVNLAHRIGVRIADDDKFDDNRDVNACIVRVVALRKRGEDPGARVAIVESTVDERGGYGGHVFYRCCVVRGDGAQEPWKDTLAAVAERLPRVPDAPDEAPGEPPKRGGFEFP